MPDRNYFDYFDFDFDLLLILETKYISLFTV